MAMMVTREDIDAARARLQQHAVETPLLRSPALDEAVGGTVLIKPECLQRTGSFKFRGAFNRLSLIAPEDRARGVVACSSGNHAQGVAEAARILGMSATIVMPADAPEIKLQRTRAFGAEVVTFDRGKDDRDAIAAEICARSGGTFIHPYNDPGVIAGQATVGLEIAKQAKEIGKLPEAALACTGGGGLASGIALALHSDLPDCDFYTTEPEGFDDYARSLASGNIETNSQLSGSVCDAILTPSPGEVPFPILKELARDGLVVSDDEALQAVAFAFRELKIVVEPGGAVALAAVLSGKLDVKDRTVAVVLTGGNIDPAMLQRALAL
ncbi:threonine/serine dehydratase [Labrenzia sp. CE80]|uniref:threonine ammonia-lyase n=1 Tax=Labrenzia sp. CE80 TaxID=1788986 RepID=UPI00129A5C19|nr:threonine/serine dehydratase [Labrenzia sp. CE80]